MIKNFTLLLFLFASITLNAQNINIPDANFKKALVDNAEINTNGDEEISEDEALAFTGEIDVNSLEISDLTGIEHFKNITKLNCHYNKLTSIDVSQNTALTYFYCHINQITQLDVSNNTALTLLLCGGNQLSNLNISNNTALKELGCADNQLTQLNVSMNANLLTLLCAHNQLSQLDLTNNKTITHLQCNINQLNNLDLNNNKLITTLICEDNQLTNLNISNNTALKELSCGGNQLTNLDLIENKAITKLYCSNNQLSNLDLSKNTLVSNLVCNNNLFTLSELQKIKNHYSNLNYSSSKKIFSPIIESDGFEIDYSSEALIDGKETVFTWYDINNNIANESIVSNIGTGMYKFLNSGVYYCKLTNTTFPDLTLQTNNISIYSNNVINIPDANFKKALVDNTEINTNGDGEISEYEANAFKGEINANKLNISDLSGIEYFTNITKLQCSDNQITSLDVSKNTELTSLDCALNQLTNLDVSNNKELTSLNCASNQLINLDLENNTKLTDLNCFYNDLSSLKLSSNIIDLYCHTNKFPFSELFKIKQKYSELAYGQSKKLFSEQNKETGFTVDYSSEILIDGNTTSFIWYKGFGEATTNEDIIEEDTGVFKFLKEGNFYCEMTNASFPGLTLKTNKLTISQPIFINIPDAIFKKALVENTEINTDGDVEISESEANTFTGEINIKEKGISDLTGIEYFSRLKSLNVYANQLTSLDLTNNTAIESLDCGSNQLTSLDLTNNTAITRLICYSNQLTNLDLSKNTAITQIYCADNQLGSLDLTSNTAITNLNCNGNQLTSLDLTNNTAITSLDCKDNLFPFSELQKIKEHYSELAYESYKRLFSPIDEIINYQIDYSSEVLIDGNETSFKWYRENSEVTAEDLQEDGNGLFSFLKDGAYYCKMTNAGFPDLTLKTNTINIYNNDIVSIPDANFKKALVENTQLNIDGNSEITEYEAAIYKSELDISGKEIGNLMGIEYFINLKILKCQDNKLGGLFIENNNKLEELDCSGNQMQEINLPNNLKTINCSGNLLIIFDISNCTELTYLDCSANEIDDLDIRLNKKLINLNCSYNDLNKLSLTESNSQLVKLNFDQNHLPLSRLNEIKKINPVLVEVEKLHSGFVSRQFDVFNTLEDELEFKLDYSKEALFNKKETTFTWTKDYGMTNVDENSVEVVKPGVFKFLKTGIYHCEMTNEEFPDIVVATSEIKINRHTQEITFINVPDPARATEEFELIATASSGLDVTFELISGDASINEKTITCNKEGIVEIKATQAGNDEYKPTEATIEITVDIPTGINDVLKSSIQVYPNPVVTDLNISFEKSEDRIIYIYDLKGQIQHQQESFSNSEQLNISDFKSGMYILKIQSESGTVNYKILKN